MLSASARSGASLSRRREDLPGLIAYREAFAERADDV